MRCRVLLPIALCCLAACTPGDGSDDGSNDAGGAASVRGRLRIATFNVAMGLERPGELAAALARRDDPRLVQLAEILQRVRPDILLLNEFDYDPAVDVAALLDQHYLSRGHHGQQPIRYPHHFRAAVNTGVDSGLDLDGDGATGGPGDAWGFGHFPGQYGMLVLSRFALHLDQLRTFQQFRWSALPGARRPLLPGSRPFYPDATWSRLRLSSKSHWDLAINLGGSELHLLTFHPTPPVFDGPEDRNGRRNHDEIRFWREYTDPAGADFIVDDAGAAGGIGPGTAFVIAGDFNADPKDGDSIDGAAAQLLETPWIDAGCLPTSDGGAQAATQQGGVNLDHRGDPAADTADFNDAHAGNLRLDYLLPSRGLEILGCGVFWPTAGQDGAELTTVSDHRLVWLDLDL
jgi:endonuclease/exonuclease/phosphatase family metal-dependent hydrolase